MTLILLLPLMAAGTPEDYCKSDTSNLLPYSFCIADQEREKADAELGEALELARAAAHQERVNYAEWEETGRSSTFQIDEVAALETAQYLWRISMEADCELHAARFRKAMMAFIPLQEQANCEAKRINERKAFLNRRYLLSGD